MRLRAVRPRPAPTQPAPASGRRLRLAMRCLATLAIAAAAATTTPRAEATEAVAFAGPPTLTADGTSMIFAWRGDLWSAPTAGGAVQRLTTHPGDDRDPRLSPDGEHIAFVSTRTGSSQIFVMPASGGTPRQVTVHTEGFGLEGWYPDGESLLVSGSRDHFWRRSGRFFRQPLEGNDAPELLFDGYGSDASLSHDGRRVLFTREGTRWWRKGYHGPQASQIWHHDTTEGTFDGHTTHEHGERHPRWLPDGSYLYTSQETGAFNLFRRDPATGDSTQLTFFDDDGAHRPVVSRDGRIVVFQRLADLYRLDLEDGARPEKIELAYGGDPWMDPLQRSTLDRATDVAFSKDAREIAFIAGGDVWVMDTELREPLRVTDTPEEERDPAFAPDFGSIVFVSDAGGQCDLWKATRADDDRYWWQQDEFRLERLTRDPKPESDPRFTPDGRISYLALRGDLWIMDTDGKNAEKLIPSWNDIRYDFSPDGRWLVYAVQDDDFNRDVWIRPVDGSREPFNLSRHPDNEGDPVWSPDGTMIAFTGRRYDTEVDLFYAHLRKAGDEETARDRKLEKALEKMKGRKKGDGKKDDDRAKRAKGSSEESKAAKEKVEASATAKATRDPLTGTWDGSLSGPAPLPPEGLGVTFELVLGEDGTVTGTATPNGLGAASIEEGRFDASTGTFTASVGTEEGMATIEATVKDDTMQGSWKLAIGLEGTLTATRRPLPGAGAAAVAAASDDADTGERKGDGDADEEEEEKDEDRVVIDFDGLEDRIQRVSIPNSSEGSLLWSPDSKKLAFRASVDGKRGLYTIEFPDSLRPKLLTTSVGSGGVWLEEGPQIVWLANGRPTSVSKSGKATTYDFQARHEVDLRAKHAAAFDQAWRTMRDRFYDERLGNNNWDAVGRKYREMAASCMTPGELSTVVNLMLGELNGSHLGFFARGRSSFRPDGWRDVTAHLGARYDETHLGPGIRVKDVIEGTPASLEASRLEPGDVILSIDGETVDPSLDLSRVLTGPLDRELLLRVRSAGGEERDVTIRPTTYGAVRSRLYEHWIEGNRAHVDELSDGKIGYLHIRGMNWPSFQRFENELYAVGEGKDGLIIDVRENGGGFTTDHLLTALTQPRHAITVPRGGGRGYPHDRVVYATWDKPILVLCNQNSFSNAEIFSHAVKTLERGKVVGVQTAGGVISTGGTGIMDIGFLRLPFRGWYLWDDGEDMELNGCMPHHVVWPLPTEMPSGTDRQLDKGIEVLLEDIAAWKAEPRPELRKASERPGPDEAAGE